MRRLSDKFRVLRSRFQRRAAEQRLDVVVINSLRLAFEDSGQLPADPLQITCIQYLEAVDSAMASTMPAEGDDGGTAYRAAQEALARAADDYNGERKAAGLPANMPRGLP